MRTAGELFALRHHVHTADNDGHAKADGFTHNFKLICNLYQHFGIRFEWKQSSKEDT